MTPQDLREKRLNILEAMLVTESEEWLDRLESLDKEYTAAQSPQDAFYALIRTHDAEYHALMQSQGHIPSQRAIIDTMIASLVKYAETLPEEAGE